MTDITREELRQFPRRNNMDEWTPAERAIALAMDLVEELPADERLTRAVVLLGEARDAVADFVDGVVAPPEAPARITYTPEQEAELASMWSEPLREWAETFLREVDIDMDQPLPPLHLTFAKLYQDGLISPTVEGVIAFQWWNTKKMTAPGWDDPAPSPAATFRKYAREVGGQAGI